MSSLRKLFAGLLLSGFEGTQLPAEFSKSLHRESLGGLILFARNYKSRNQLKQLTAQIDETAATQVFVAVDQEGGRVVRFDHGFPHYPSPAYYSKKSDYAGAVGALVNTGLKLKEIGVNLNLVPVLDLAPNDRNSVIYRRAVSALPELVSHYASTLMVKFKERQLLCCAKHFPGLASAQADPHLQVAISEQSSEKFYDTDFLPFQAAIKAGAPMIMITHLLAKELDSREIATFSSKIIAGNLQQKLGFTGLVVADDLQMAGAKQAGTDAQAAIRALKAGCHLLIFGNLSGQLTNLLDRVSLAAKTDSHLRIQIESAAEKVWHFKRDYQERMKCEQYDSDRLT